VAAPPSLYSPQKIPGRGALPRNARSPDETIQPSSGLICFSGLLVVGIARFIERLGFLAGVLGGLRCRGVQDVNFHCFLSAFRSRSNNARAPFGDSCRQRPIARRVSGVHAIRRRGLVQIAGLPEQPIGNWRSGDTSSRSQTLFLARHYQIPSFLLTTVVDRRQSQLICSERQCVSNRRRDKYPRSVPA